MEITLEKKSGILFLKSKFFLFRSVTYFSFLLVPIWIQKSLQIGKPIQILVMSFYLAFMVGQWFLLGKEIDYRLKIYYRVNSAMDRIIYRLILGMTAMILYFNLLSFLPGKWIYNLFWMTWIFLGLFYSWPTRGKIIQESMSSHAHEFSHLDAFEKTLVGLTFIMFLFSLPSLPLFNSVEALKLVFDPAEKISLQFWNFLSVNYFPFKRYPDLFRLAWSMHFYVIGMGLYLFTFYGFLRFFVSRRLALLGVFSLLSSWSYAKILSGNVGLSITNTYSIIFIWAFLWAAKSSTYRTGLFVGLVGYLGTLIHSSYAFLLIGELALINFYFLKEKTSWYRREFFKYALLGLILSIISLLVNFETLDHLIPLRWKHFDEMFVVLARKSFNALSIVGAVLIFFLFKREENFFLKGFRFNNQKFIEFSILAILILLCAFLFDFHLMDGFAIMWMVAFLALIPLEVLFQRLSRERSGRNIIYVIYILICLLDSHFEGRVKIVLRLLSSGEN